MQPHESQIILTIDIGGSHIKAILLNTNGEPISGYEKINTPQPAAPNEVIAAISQLIQPFQGFNKVSAGFPGYVRDGIVYTAPNLGSENWKEINFAAQLSQALGKPAKVVNDADLQGLGIANGKGLEMIVTLGTGFGTALVYNGSLLPHLEIAHHPITKKKTYDEYIGEKAMEEIGEEKWNIRLQKVLAILKTVFNYDRLYISGGNAKKISFTLDNNISLSSNKEGIKGGAKLWL